MTEVVLKNPFEGGRTLSTQQLQAYEKAYGSLKNSVVEEDKQTSAQQTRKLKEYLSHLESIGKKAETNRSECELKIEQLRHQGVDLQAKLKEYERVFKNSNREEEYRTKISGEEQQFLGFCKKRIEIASSIDMKKLAKLDIDERKSEANDLFKWILVAIYNEPENKYYWSNFKEQAIEEDKGKDLVERLGKINAFHAKEEQKVKTAKFLANYENVIKAEEFKGFESEVEKIHEIAKLFQSSCEAGRRVKDYEKRIEESRKEFQKSDEDNLQNSKNYNAIQERIRVSESYLKQLREMQNLIDGKLTKYSQQISAAETYIGEMEKVGSYVPTSHVFTEKEERDNCTCAIY